MVASNDPVLAECTRIELLRVPTGKRDARGSQNGRWLRSFTSKCKSPVTESDLAALNHQVESKAIDGYLWLHVQPGQAVPEATYVSRGTADDFLGADKMQTAIGDALVREALMNHGMASSQADGLLHDVDLKTRQVKNGQAVSRRRQQELLGRLHHGVHLVFCRRVLRNECGPFRGGGEDIPRIRSTAGDCEAGIADGGQAAGSGRGRTDANGRLDYSSTAC